ncbi:glycosyltransferase [Nocardia brasiliensis]|uniref:Glycosyltransferase n=1 Tax=Nocardia brasiliensis TaxID=37326 RepID=A0A6G9XQQ1_NOCBR|nr:glycosyltransferase [Nocardia brasiliensis]QIS03247.1 glycosyltransferase [Nocardia brasiliensis]
MTAPRVALVHERFTEYGGSEAVVAEFLRTWPGAAVFAPIVSTAGYGALAAQCGVGQLDSIQDSWLSRAHAVLGARAHAPLLPFVPRALRRLPLAGRFDAVVVSHHAFATQAVFATDAPVVAYVHSPARWAWDDAFRAQEAGGRAGQLALAGLGRVARRAELRAAPRLTRVIANSHAVAERVREWWGLSAAVVNPPVRIDRFTPDAGLPRENFFLFAGRLVPYKRADLAIKAAQRAGRRLVVLGEGRHRPYLESIAGPETTFLGAASDAVLLDCYRRCRALLMPGVEDFGIVPVEAMACGTPVLAVGAGGALDTVLPGATGEYLAAGEDELVVTGLARRMREFDSAAYDSVAIRAHATTFSPAAFRARLADAVARTLDRERDPRG